MDIGRRKEMERIFMIGYMGSGKTTVGKLLAQALSLSFVDLDAYIENKYRKTIPRLFEEKGEDEFRKMESLSLKEVSEFEDVVISTGGGTPCFFDNMEVMNRTGLTVYLDAHPEDLADHLLASRTVRPLIVGKSREELIPFITEHLARRETYYKKAKIVYPLERMVTKKEIHLTVNRIEEQVKRRIAQ